MGIATLAALALPLAGIHAARAQSPVQPTVQTPAPVPMALDTPSVKTAPASTAQPPSVVLDTPSVNPAGDKSALASPVAVERKGATIPVGTAVSVQMSEAVDSGTRRNGDTVHGVLAAALRTSASISLPPGTKVEGTVVSAAKAGTVGSAGVLSLQLTRVGGVELITDVVDFNGQEGHKDVADSAPAKGTEAMVQAGAVLKFHVLENGRATGLAPAAQPNTAPPKF